MPSPRAATPPLADARPHECQLGSTVAPAATLSASGPYTLSTSCGPSLRHRDRVPPCVQASWERRRAVATATVVAVAVGTGSSGRRSGHPSAAAPSAAVATVTAAAATTPAVVQSRRGAPGVGAWAWWWPSSRGCGGRAAHAVQLLDGAGSSVERMVMNLIVAVAVEARTHSTDALAAVDLTVMLIGARRRGSCTLLGGVGIGRRGLRPRTAGPSGGRRNEH